MRDPKLCFNTCVHANLEHSALLNRNPGHAVKKGIEKIDVSGLIIDFEWKKNSFVDFSLEIDQNRKINLWNIFYE